MSRGRETTAHEIRPTPGRDGPGRRFRPSRPIRQDRFCPAASRMSVAISSGCEISDRWLAFSSIVLAPIRFAMNRSRSGSIVRSSVDTAYQLGLLRQAACVDASGEQRVRDRPLDRIQYTRLGRRGVACEIAQKGLFAQFRIAVGPDQSGRCRWRRVGLGESGVILAGVGRSGAT